MTDPTPPPERPLPPAARARIRSELIAYADEHRSRAPRWAVPAGAAAAVALVAGMAWWAVGAGGPEPSGVPVTGGDASILPVPTPIASTAATERPESPSATPSDDVAGDGDCVKELRDVLPGATEAFGSEPFSYWVKGERFSVCYQGEDRTTVTRPQPLTPPADDVATYGVLSVFTDAGLLVRAAGGVVPDGAPAFAVDYTFPDGHTEPAVTGTDAQGRTWWRMAYAYDPGKGSELDQPPIEVTVSLSGVQRHYTLEWGVDTCAQANHGC